MHWFALVSVGAALLWASIEAAPPSLLLKEQALVRATFALRARSSRCERGTQLARQPPAGRPSFFCDGGGFYIFFFVITNASGNNTCC
jgi:hypothetical protein